MEERVAALFRELGCSAEIAATVKGARGTHRVDVWVMFETFGQSVKWVAECKLWRTRVTKEKVLALRQVVEDVGADRGILISDSGFQPSAEDVARWTNILLTTPDTLEALARDAIRTRKLETLDRSIQLLKNRMMDLHEAEGIPPFEIVTSPEPIVEETTWYSNFGQLTVAEMGLHSALADRFPLVLPRPGPNGGIARTFDIDEFFTVTGAALAEVELWLTNAERVVNGSAQKREKNRR